MSSEIEAAHKAHDRLVASHMESFKSAISAASTALKLLVAVNAGGIIALFGFVGAVAGKNVLPSTHLVSAPVEAWAGGLTMGVLATLGMYVSQGLFLSSSRNKRISYEHPFVEDTPRSKVYRVFGNLSRVVTVTLAGGSLTCFLYGAWLCRPLLLAIRVS